jgi:hypothetical protein
VKPDKVHAAQGKTGVKQVQDYWVIVFDAFDGQEVTFRSNR